MPTVTVYGNTSPGIYHLSHSLGFHRISDAYQIVFAVKEGSLVQGFWTSTQLLIFDHQTNS